MLSHRFLDPRVLAYALLIVIQAAFTIYYLAFAAHRVGWTSFGAVAMAHVVFSRARTQLGPKEPPSQFLLQNKKPILVTAGFIIVLFVALCVLLKGTPYQTELLGILLALGNLFAISLDYGYLRQALLARP